MEQLIKTIQDIRADLGMSELKNPKKLGRKKLEEMYEKLMQQADETPEGETVQEEVVEPTETIKEEVVEPTETIKELSCRLLCEVDHVNEEGRTVGRPYLDILDDIIKQRPGVNTSLNCLRWYAGKIRSQFNGYQQYELPQIRARRAKA